MVHRERSQRQLFCLSILSLVSFPRYPHQLTVDWHHRIYLMLLTKSFEDVRDTVILIFPIILESVGARLRSFRYRTLPSHYYRKMELGVRWIPRMAISRSADGRRKADTKSSEFSHFHSQLCEHVWAPCGCTSLSHCLVFRALFSQNSLVSSFIPPSVVYVVQCVIRFRRL